jgi:hypothetical protein
MRLLQLLPLGLCVALAGSTMAPRSPTITLDLDEAASEGIFKINTKMAGVKCTGVLGGEKLANHPLCRVAEDNTHTEKFTVTCAAGESPKGCHMPTAKAWDHHDGR